MSERRYLSDGSSIPAIGFGTNQMDTDAIASAIDVGFRMLDTAWVYGNESAVGDAIRGSGVPRDEFTVITKLPGRAHGVDEARASLTESLASLGLDHVDLYLIHWPMPRVDRYVDAWKGLIALREEGLVRSIGVSNFNPDHVLRLIEETGVAPVVDQVELHPHFIQAEQRAFAAGRGIPTMSWSPLGRRADLMADATIATIAERHGVSPAQVVVRWHIELGSVPIPRSTSAARQAENFDVFGFSLDADEVAAISRLDSGVRLWGGDPETKEEF
ncbi:diketogulonate reductase-like aldo/keto reductase [Homoserinimonas aerilata]|uniref:Diketogulonate reductase-like aldo/keto reductase n=1 Tax=Homoserinimonas aerilata TaxID=1162970 RepID=A0A542YAD3_9MICO|nr:diketogulonate reductase-like aldo/keto reductase [Homoserinimonas aerilata]